MLNRVLKGRNEFFRDRAAMRHGARPPATASLVVQRRRSGSTILFTYQSPNAVSLGVDTVTVAASSERSFLVGRSMTIVVGLVMNCVSAAVITASRGHRRPRTLLGSATGEPFVCNLKQIRLPRANLTCTENDDHTRAEHSKG